MECDNCGLPIGIGQGNVWMKTGVIYGKNYPYQKGTIFDVDDFNNLFRVIAKDIGLNIDHIITAGKYGDTKMWMSAFVQHIRETLGDRMPGNFELFNLLADFTRIWGLAKVKILEYEESKEGKLEVENAYSIPLLTADIKATIKALEGNDVKLVWKGDEHFGLVTGSTGGAEPEEKLTEVYRPTPETEPKEENYLDCERCPICNAPLEISRLFDWNWKEAMIIERLTGRRYGFNDTKGIVAVVRRLLSELGEEMNERIVEVERDYSRSLYETHAGKLSYQELLSKFPFMGWGLIQELEDKKDRLRIVCKNPFSEHMISGRVWGMLEGLKGETLSLKWKLDREMNLDMILTSRV